MITNQGMAANRELLTRHIPYPFMIRRLNLLVLPLMICQVWFCLGTMTSNFPKKKFGIQAHDAHFLDTTLQVSPCSQDTRGHPKVSYIKGRSTFLGEASHTLNPF